MKNNEKGITMISLVIALMLLIIIASASVKISLDGISSIDETKQAGSDMERTSIIESIQGEVENLRTIKLINGQNIKEEDILNIMKKIADQYPELTYSNGKIKSIKEFDDITVEEVKAKCEI